ncbi:MAG: gliding motility-associated ABC transporter substrate-binding protein GldG [Paludibacter sp.]|nr:gliding motility-associated ABC transporter substrate-binding protein GldG [Paludibacter sp.]
MKIRNSRNIYFYVSILAIISISFFYFFRIDLTSEKRYSIADQTKKMMNKVDAPLDIIVYLDGDLNPGFLRLKKSASDFLEELSVYSKKPINIRFENPSQAENTEEREKKYANLVSKGLTSIAVFERDKEGKSIQKIIFPWIEISYKGTIIPVNLLKNIRGNSGEENLNISIENLEFEITDALRRLTNKEVKKIAFIEGHGELNEAETYDISKSLSRYFQIDRGKLGTNASILSEYKAIIIAKPTQPFSETDKFIIDQYIMNGGRVLWLLDGVRIAKENLSSTGLSPAMELDLNLNDQLFKYGVRINPVILQDVQCVTIPVNIAPANVPPQFEPTPWYYAPLLLASPTHPATRNITEVKSDFCSGIDIVGNNKKVNFSLLLVTSDNTHIVGIPTTINVNEIPKADDKAYFNMSYIPVAVELNGIFESNFANRILPKEVINPLPFRAESFKTMQIVIADGDIIRNETNGIASDSTTLPLGFDRYMNQQFGNKDFIQNAVLYLTDNDGWMKLRSRTIQLRLLNKKISNENRIVLQMFNIVFPILLLLIFGFAYQTFRKRKYTK